MQLQLHFIEKVLIITGKAACSLMAYEIVSENNAAGRELVEAEIAEMMQYLDRQRMGENAYMLYNHTEFDLDDMQQFFIDLNKKWNDKGILIRFYASPKTFGYVAPLNPKEEILWRRETPTDNISSAADIGRPRGGGNDTGI